MHWPKTTSAMIVRMTKMAFRSMITSQMLADSQQKLDEGSTRRPREERISQAADDFLPTGDPGELPVDPREVLRTTWMFGYRSGREDQTEIFPRLAVVRHDPLITVRYGIRQACSG